MSAPSTFGLSSEARNLHWLLTNLVEEVPGILSVAVVSSDGLLLLSSDPDLAKARTDSREAAAGGPPRRGPGGAPARAAPPPTWPPSSRASAASPSAPPS